MASHVEKQPLFVYPQQHRHVSVPVTAHTAEVGHHPAAFGIPGNYDGHQPAEIALLGCCEGIHGELRINAPLPVCKLFLTVAIRLVCSPRWH